MKNRVLDPIKGRSFVMIIGEGDDIDSGCGHVESVCLGVTRSFCDAVSSSFRSGRRHS